MVETLAITVFLLICLSVISLCMYNFQIKEYRFDRLVSAIKEKGIWSYIFPERFYFPKKSVRNRNIAFISVFLIILYFLLTWFLLSSQTLRFVLYFLSPLFSVSFVILGILYTYTIVKRKRAETIKEAVERIEKSQAVFIGITGSFGKTSTKEFLYKLLSSTFEVEKTDENQNTDIGIAMSINKNLKESTQYFIVEMGAYKQGEIENICNVVHPKYGLLTGLSNQHLDLFGSKENLISAKSELLKSLPKDGKAYVNADSFGYKEAIKNLRCGVCLFSMESDKYDIFCHSISTNGWALTATVNYKNSRRENDVLSISTNLLGEHNIANLLPCIALSLDLGVPKNIVEDSILNISSLRGRLSKHVGLCNATFVYDGYSSNFKGFLAALNALGDMRLKKKFLVTKGIIELGDEKRSSYVDIVERASCLGIKIVTTDSLFKKLGKGNVQLIRSENKILNYIKQNADKDTVVLIEGRFSDRFISSLNLK